MASFEANVAAEFPGAKKLDVLEGNRVVKTVSLDKAGNVKVDGLDNGQYALTDGGRRIAFSLKDVLPSNTRAVKDAQAILEREAAAKQGAKNPNLASAAPGYTTTPNVVTGARGSNDAKRKVKDPNPQPHPSQEDVQGVPQRSDTPFGEAHPVSKEEIATERDPEKATEKLQGQPMCSDTEFGSNPVIPKAELADHDEEGVDPRPKNTPLASDTELGSKPPAFVSNEVPAEDSPPIKEPVQVPSEGVRQPAAKVKASKKKA